VNPFGPILRFELVRAARRQRLILTRCAYAVAAAALVTAVYATATKGWQVRLRPHDLAELTEGLFYGLLAVQFALAVVIATNWTPDAITAEKERRTLPFLLATPLTDGEIVLGKLFARLARIGLILLAGLPVLCALEFFGGLEPETVLVAYAVLAATVVSVGSLSLLCAIYVPTAKAAGQRAARIVGLYVVGMIGLRKLLGVFPAVALWPGGVVTVADFVDALDAGNPLDLVERFIDAVRGRAFADATPPVRNYIVFHVIAAGVFVAWAVLRLRPVAGAQADAPPPKRTGLFRPPPRPPCGDRPVLWKALHFDFRQSRTAAGRAVAQVVFGVSFAPAAVTLAIIVYIGAWSKAPDIMNQFFVRGLGTMVLTGVLAMIAAYASSCIARERRKQTLDDLLLTDLTAAEILAQKWWASILVVRPALIWVGIHWVLAVVTGGLHPLAVPLLVVEWSAYAAFAASLGVYWAARMPTARAAGVPTGVIGFGAVAAPIVAGILIGVATEAEGPAFVLAGTASPPIALWLSAFTAHDFTAHGDYVAPIVVGVTASVVAAAVASRRLWRGACRRFRR
jgi:ABC-type transport system involved in multi-copper enzyme maturation permease subunit